MIYAKGIPLGEERLINFSVLIVEIVESMPKTRAGNILVGQLIRSGTSTALNYGEAQSGESRKDFIHKIKIVLFRRNPLWEKNYERLLFA